MCRCHLKAILRCRSVKVNNAINAGPNCSQTTTTTVLWPSYRSTCVSRMHLQLRTEEDFVGAKFYCLHSLADGNQRIRIREKTLELSSTVQCYLHCLHATNYLPLTINCPQNVTEIKHTRT